MSARLSAIVCLLLVGAAGARAESALEGASRIAVYLRSRPADIPAASFAAMQQETGSLMRRAGLSVQWLDQTKPTQVEAAFLTVIGFEGSCAPWPVPKEMIPLGLQPLGSTLLADGRIQPFSKVDCLALRQFLAPALAQAPKSKQDFLFGRALGRLVAHELYHFVAQTKGHAIAGISQSSVSARDLISDQFTFGEEALAKLRAGAPAGEP